MKNLPTVLTIALALLLSACTVTTKSTPIAGSPFSIRSADTFTPDSHAYEALFYGDRELAEDIGDYSSSPDPEILLYHNKELDGGLYVFDGHKGTNTKIHDVAAETYTDSTGRKWSSDAVLFPMGCNGCYMGYYVRWSPDAAYVVIEDNNHPGGRLQIIDVPHARVVAPGWLLSNMKPSVSKWETNRIFVANTLSKDRVGTVRVTVDPLQIQTKSGETIWPPQ